MTSLLCSGGARGDAPFPLDMHMARGCAEGNACSLVQNQGALFDVAPPGTAGILPAYRCRQDAGGPRGYGPLQSNLSEKTLGRQPYTRCCCFELFHHAIVRRDDLAWEALYARYGAMVRGWLGAGVGDGDEAVALVFERFWRAVDAEKFARFDTLPAVLQYLKACARTARLDQVRAARGETLPLLDEALALPAREDVADLVAGRVDAPGFWRTVRGVLAGEREELVFHLSYVVGLSPREIRARHSAQFPDVAEVYRLRRNLLDRLRRAPEVRALLHAA